MTIKKNTLKTMCAVLTCTTLLGGLLAANATDIIVTEGPMDDSVDSELDWNTEESNLEEIEVTYTQASSYSVSIPKAVALDANKQAAYSVKVTGSIDTNQRVYVAPVDGIAETEKIDFYMRDQTPDSKKSDVVANVTQNKSCWNSEEVANGYEEVNNSISAPDLTFGTWKGALQMEIRLESIASHVHEYVDGKCECGEIDPNHTHNYVDGVCTICGSEAADPYETAPASAYSDWNYTLDDINKTITLTNYTGSATDVIVYANYPIGEETYTTKLSDKYSCNMFTDKKSTIQTVKFSKSIDTSNVTDMSRLFYECTALTSIDISGFNTSNVTNMGQMFSGCTALTSLDISNFDTSNVTTMNSIFDRCSSLTSLDVSNLNTSNVTDMNYMFNRCSSLASLDVSNIDTSKVNSMYSMFSSCVSLTSLDLSNFDTHNVTTMNRMFSGCNALTSLALSNFDTSNVTDMGYMFYICSKLTDLDLCAFDTSKVTEMSGMFQNCTNLKTIYVTNGKWRTPSSSAKRQNMFSGCGTSSVTYK